MHALFLLQLWELCRDCNLLDRNVGVSEVNRLLQQLRARHTDAVYLSYVSRKEARYDGVCRAVHLLVGRVEGTSVGMMTIR